MNGHLGRPNSSPKRLLPDLQAQELVQALVAHSHLIPLCSKLGQQPIEANDYGLLLLTTTVTGLLLPRFALAMDQYGFWIWDGLASLSTTK